MSGSFQVELKINTGKEKPAIGMFGKATIMSNEARHLYSVPYEAIVQADGNKAYVFIPQPDSSVKKVEVSIQSFNEKNVIIKSGIEAGQQVVVSNSAFLKIRKYIPPVFLLLLSIREQVQRIWKNW